MLPWICSLSIILTISHLSPWLLTIDLDLPSKILCVWLLLLFEKSLVMRNQYSCAWLLEDLMSSAHCRTHTTESRMCEGLYPHKSAKKLLYLFSHFSASLWDWFFAPPWKWYSGYRLDLVWWEAMELKDNPSKLFPLLAPFKRKTGKAKEDGRTARKINKISHSIMDLQWVSWA